MTTRIESKIQKLEQEKSELDLTFLEKKKQEYESKMYKILENQNNETNEENAISELNKVKSYRSKIRETEQKINNNSKLLEDIDRKLSLYEQANEQCNNLQLYRDTREGIIDIFGRDIVEYAEETDNKELMNKLRSRTLTQAEYSKYFEQDYRKHDKIEKMYNGLLKERPRIQKREDLIKEINKSEDIQEVQKISKSTIILPEGLSEQIKEELKGHKDIHAKEIEDFLKKELKKNKGEIKISHIKNKFGPKSIIVTKILKNILKDYPEFKIINNSEKNNECPVKTKSKHDKLISSISTETQEHKNTRIKQDNLLKELNGISKDEDLNHRIEKYLDLFEKVEGKFSNKEYFAEELAECITTHANIKIEKEIQKLLRSIIQDNLHLEKTGLYGYYVYRLNSDSRRIIAYPNGEIFTICAHEEYEKLINVQPPIGKTE